jgi:prophage regulatory protein
LASQENARRFFPTRLRLPAMDDQRQRSLRILREPDVQERTGLSASERKLLELRHQFPVRVALGPRSIGWLEHEIDDWIAEKMACARTR